MRAGRVAILTPLTSKGTRMTHAGESPFFGVLLPSILRTWTSGGGGGGGWRHSFYVGVDVRDPIYDAPGGADAFLRAFRSHVPSTEVPSAHPDPEIQITPRRPPPSAHTLLCACVLSAVPPS